MLNNPIGRLRLIGLLEGSSFLILLLIAMPLKYAADLPVAVKYVGGAHGALFLLYLLALAQVAAATDWGFKKIAGAFIASVIPLGTFVMDKYWKADEQALLAAPHPG